MSAHLVDLPFKLIFVTWAALILRKLALGPLPSLEKLLSSNTVVQIACFLLLDTIKVYSVPSPQDNPARAVPMPSYEEVTQRAGSLRALPGLTAAEFQAVLPHFEQAFMTSMDDRTIDGQPRTSRRYTPYDTCPLPTI